MSTDTVHTVAQRDTPDWVDVPNNWRGLLIWAVVRFGPGMLFAVIMGWFLSVVYTDQKVTSERLLVLLEARAVSDVKLADAMSQLSRAVDDLKREAQTAHRKP